MCPGKNYLLFVTDELRGDLHGNLHGDLHRFLLS